MSTAKTTSSQLGLLNAMSTFVPGADTIALSGMKLDAAEVTLIKNIASDVRKHVRYHRSGLGKYINHQTIRIIMAICMNEIARRYWRAPITSKGINQLVGIFAKAIASRMATLANVRDRCLRAAALTVAISTESQ